MTAETTKKMAAAFNLLSDANNAMIEVIKAAVKDEGTFVSFEETMDERTGYTELRFIKYNEDGDLCMFDDYDNEILHIDDLSADDLYDICLHLK